MDSVTLIINLQLYRTFGSVIIAAREVQRSERFRANETVEMLEDTRDLGGDPKERKTVFGICAVR